MGNYLPFRKVAKDTEIVVQDSEGERRVRMEDRHCDKQCLEDVCLDCCKIIKEEVKVNCEFCAVTHLKIALGKVKS